MPVPTWEDCAYYTAKAWALRSQCLHDSVGSCILTEDGELIGVGYNGPARGTTHCERVGCARDRQRSCVDPHSERNAIICASSHAGDLADTILLTTGDICSDCAKVAANARIKVVIFTEPGPEHDQVAFLFREIGIAYRQYVPVRKFGIKVPPGTAAITCEDCAMATAEIWSHRTKCTKHRVGCVIITKEGMLVGEGYNGPVRGAQHCNDPLVGCAKVDGVGPERVKMRCRGTHGEDNAIVRASQHVGDLNGMTILVTTEPCHRCALAITNAGIRRVIYRDPYVRVADKDDHVSEHDEVIELFQDAGIAIGRYNSTRRIEVTLEPEPEAKGD